MLFRLYVRIASWSSGRRDNRIVSGSGRRDNRIVSGFWRRRRHSGVDLRRANDSRIALVLLKRFAGSLLRGATLTISGLRLCEGD